MRKIFIIATLVALGAGANATADDEATSLEGDGDVEVIEEVITPAEHNNKSAYNLTEEQKACIEAENCPKFKRKSSGDEPVIKDRSEKRKRGDKKEFSKMSEEEKAALAESRDCIQAAYEKCGVEMLEMPESSGRAKGNRKSTERPVAEELSSEEI